MSRRMLPGGSVVRVEWLPGSDLLRGTCHCSATHEAQDPISMWEWLLAHPEGHDAGPQAPGPDGSAPEPAPRVLVDAP